jgi:hypothetical protein
MTKCICGHAKTRHYEADWNGQCPELGCDCVAFVEDDTRPSSAPDPLKVAERAQERLGRVFVMATEGRDREIDALAVCVEVLNELEPDARGAALAYLVTRFGGPT